MAFWKMRNDHIFCHTPFHLSFVVENTKVHIFRWNVTHILPLVAIFMGIPSEEWKPPVQGQHKLKFDGCLNPTAQTEGVGGIIRDHKGDLMAAYTGTITATRPLEAELQFLLQGVFLCPKGIRNVILEGDCLILVENL